MLNKTCSSCTAACPAQAPGDILDDPAGLMRLKCSNTSAAVVEGNQLDANKK